jgi:hypothetical protein
MSYIASDQALQTAVIAVGGAEAPQDERMSRIAGRGREGIARRTNGAFSEIDLLSQTLKPESAQAFLTAAFRARGLGVAAGGFAAASARSASSFANRRARSFNVFASVAVRSLSISCFTCMSRCSEAAKWVCARFRAASRSDVVRVSAKSGLLLKGDVGGGVIRRPSLNAF